MDSKACPLLCPHYSTTLSLSLSLSLLLSKIKATIFKKGVSFQHSKEYAWISLLSTLQ